jgi:hypothetical protein
MAELQKARLEWNTTFSENMQIIQTTLNPPTK